MNYEDLFWKLMTLIFENREHKHPSESEKEKLETLSKEFSRQTLENIFHSPGKFFVNNSGIHSKSVEKYVGIFWEDYTFNEIYEEMTSGVLNAHFWSTSIDYYDRLKDIKPTIISKRPKDIDKIEHIYSEALICYGHGLNKAAIALSAAAIEKSLRSVMMEKDERSIKYFDQKRGRWMDKGFGALIFTESRDNMGILSDEMSAEAKKLNRSRNKIMHESKTISAKETLMNIERAKNILIHIFSSVSLGEPY